MNYPNYIRNRWNDMMRRLGRNTKEVAQSAEVAPHKLRSLLAPRHNRSKEQERQKIVAQVRKVLPADEASSFTQMVTEAQAGELGEVVARLTLQVKTLKHENQWLREQIRRMERQIEHLTPTTSRRAIRLHKVSDGIRRATGR